MPGLRAAKITYDFDALQHNFQVVKTWAPRSLIMPVIKANAYGHGMLQVAEHLMAADGFAVAQFSEALLLREAYPEIPITVLQGFLTEFQLNRLLEHNLRPVINQHWQIDYIESNASDKAMDVWIKVNTGMGRLGFEPANVEAVIHRLNKISSVQKTGLMMHFENADVPEHMSNQKQIDQFVALSEKFKIETSASNSAAIVGRLLAEQNWVRPGIMLYGASPLQDKTAVELKLKPVMSLTAELIAINHFKKGQTVGYGDTWCCPEDMFVGIVNAGYGDGYPRNALAAPVILNGQQSKTIGRVSMDSFAIDLRGINARCGDEVECWGAQVAVDEVARSAQTIAYELLCNAG